MEDYDLEGNDARGKLHSYTKFSDKHSNTMIRYATNHIQDWLTVPIWSILQRQNFNALKETHGGGLKVERKSYDSLVTLSHGDFVIFGISHHSVYHRILDWHAALTGMTPRKDMHQLCTNVSIYLSLLSYQTNERKFWAIDMQQSQHDLMLLRICTHLCSCHTIRRSIPVKDGSQNGRKERG